MNRPRVLRLFFLALAAILGYGGWQLWDLHQTGHRDHGQRAPVGIVLGAAAWHTRPSPVLRERLNHAIRLYREGRIEKLILTGGYGAGAPYAESEVARDYCLAAGVPAADLFLEKRSQTTRANLLEAAQLMKTHHWERALLISDAPHLKRAQLLARRLGIEVEPSATRTSAFQSPRQQMKFLLKEFALYHQALLGWDGL